MKPLAMLETHTPESSVYQRYAAAAQAVDCVLSNCVLNLVRQQDRRQLFAEIFRVLPRGGRAAISDIVSDEEVPERLQQDQNFGLGASPARFAKTSSCKRSRMQVSMESKSLNDNANHGELSKESSFDR